MHPKTLSINTNRLVLMANVKDAPFKCLSCKKVFITENHLKRHEDRRHNSKNLSFPSEQVKEGAIYETGNESTMKAVLNATERIEDLLIKLAIRNNEKKPTITTTVHNLSRSNMDYSLVTSSSFSSEKNEQNFGNCKYVSTDSLSNLQTENAKLRYDKKSNFKDASVMTNPIPTDKNKQNIENCEYFSNEVIPDQKLKEISKSKFNEMTHFKDASLISNSIATSKNDPNFQNYEYSSASNKQLKEIDKFKLNKRSDSKDSSVSKTDKNEQIIEHCRYSSNEVKSNEGLKEMSKSKINKTSNFKDTSLISNSITTSKNELDIENYEYSSNESTSNKKLNEITELKENDFEDLPVPSESFTSEKSEQNIESYKCISNYSGSNKKLKEIAELKYNERSDLEDMPVASDSLVLDKSEQNIESYECISNYSGSNKKLKEIAELKCNERSDLGDMPVASDSLVLDKSEQNMESSELISIHSIPSRKSKHITKMTCSDYLEEQENKAIWRITSSIIKSSNYSLEVLDPLYPENDRWSEKNDIIAPHGDIYIEERPIKSRSSLKSEILKKLDSKLEYYGIDASQNTLSDKDMMRIGHLLKEERDRLAEEIPDYHKLRNLIKDNAHRRIEENIRVRSTYVS